VGLRPARDSDSEQVAAAVPLEVLASLFINSMRYLIFCVPAVLSVAKPSFCALCRGAQHSVAQIRSLGKYINEDSFS
jgi:hypothetical protein